MKKPKHSLIKLIGLTIDTNAEGYKIIYAIYKPVNRWKRAIFSRYSLTPDFQGGEWGDVVGVLPEHSEKAFSIFNT